ncbi:MAG: RHS repeat-associated core domain-containing protein [Polaromonas sp.]
MQHVRILCGHRFADFYIKLFFTYDGFGRRIYLTNALNCVIAQLSDDNANPGALQNSYGYSPYGQSTTVGPDTTNNPIQYTSRENDQAGLNFYRGRYYDPILKRFISEDPAGLTAGLNGYRYVNNAPTEFSDPDGELPFVPVGYAYPRCVAQCMAQSAAGAAFFDELECFDVGDNAKDCALDCLNPFNWGGKAGARNSARGAGKNKPNVPKTGKNDTHIDQAAKDRALEKWKDLKEQLDEAKRTPNKTPADKDAEQRLKRQVDHAKRQADAAGENHSMKPKK